MRNERSAPPKSRHLAVADSGQPRDRGALADCGNLRQSERVRGRLPGYDRGRQRHAERITPRHGELHLRPIGPMSLAVPELAQPVGRHVGGRRRGVDADHASLQVVDAPHRRMACACQRAPTCSVGEVIAARRPPILGEVARSDLASDAPTQGARMGVPPRLDAREPVVALGEEKSQPHHGRPAEAQALPIAVRREVLVHSFGHAHFLKGREDSRDVVDSFVGCGHVFAHPTSLTPFSFSCENSCEM